MKTKQTLDDILDKAKAVGEEGQIKPLRSLGNISHYFPDLVGQHSVKKKLSFYLDALCLHFRQHFFFYCHTVK